MSSNLATFVTQGNSGSPDECNMDVTAYVGPGANRRAIQLTMGRYPHICHTNLSEGQVRVLRDLLTDRLEGRTPATSGDLDLTVLMDGAVMRPVRGATNA